MKDTLSATTHNNTNTTTNCFLTRRTSPQVLSIDGHNFGMIPTDIFAPTSDPQFDALARIGGGRLIIKQPIIRIGIRGGMEHPGA